VHPWANVGLEPLVTWKEAWATAAIWAWLAGVFIHTISARVNVRSTEVVEEFEHVLDLMAIGVAAAIGISAATLRLFRYTTYCAAPLSLWGRIRTGRLIIPGYHRVFVAPLVASLISVCVPMLLLQLEAPAPAAAFLGVLLSLIAAIGLGPTMSQWVLTGEFRISRPTPTTRAEAGSVKE
jgi:hypothetical protein